jgi:hypothetical protein
VTKAKVLAAIDQAAKLYQASLPSWERQILLSFLLRENQMIDAAVSALPW